MFHQHSNMFESSMMEMSHKMSSENDIMGRKSNNEDDYETKSLTEGTMEVPSGDEDEQDPNQRPKKKRYHRHTQRQIQELESYVLLPFDLYSILV